MLSQPLAQRRKPSSFISRAASTGRSARRTDSNKALDYFTQAIVHDPNYAPAYVGLADCYNLLREYTLMPASEAYPRALAAAQRAVELDDQSSEAHASLAFALF